MKKTLLIAVILLSHTIVAQKYFTRTGSTNFKASVEAFEAVEATNNSTSVVLKADSGDIAALLLIKAFKFKVALMQEHFNENYMDSDKYPKATFRGKIEGFNLSEIDTKKEYKIKGSLTVRGVKKDIETRGTFSKSGNGLKLNATFSVKPQDFDIKIPSIVRKKIAKSINVTLDYELNEKK